LWGSFFALFSYFLVQAKTRRQMISIALAGFLTVALISPPPAQAQSLWGTITTVLNIIRGVIRSGLTNITNVRSSIFNRYQQQVWPSSLISQAQNLITQMVGQYRGPMQNLYNTNLGSATLTTPSALEGILRNHQTNDFSGLLTAYGNLYGSVPPVTGASPEDRAMMDMDDALALDNLKMLKVTDAAGDLTLQAANGIEDNAGQAAPGAAPFLTASAVVASIQSQAMTQKMLAAELRQEAARLAHDNALRKRGTVFTGNVSTQILNLLQHH
jgi:hypothetical protein